MRNKIIQLVVFTLILGSTELLAQSKIQLSNISFLTPESTIKVKENAFPVENGKSIDILLALINDGKTKLTLEIEAVRLKSNLSQHKAQGVKLKMKYFCTYNGENRKNKTERIFWPDQSGAFREKVAFSFGRNKLKTVSTTLTFDGNVKFE